MIINSFYEIDIVIQFIVAFASYLNVVLSIQARFCMVDEKIFIGVAWPYANGSIHLGHVAGCLLPSDIFSRFQRMQGNQVLMVSGSDEHGTPITITADKEGVSPQVIVDRYHAEHKKDLEAMHIDFDLFTRTTTQNHKEVVQDLFVNLYNKKHLYKKSVTAYYCNQCQKYLPDRYIEGVCPHCGAEGARGDQCDSCGKLLDPSDLHNPICKLCGSTPVSQDTEHVFFALSNFEKPLLDWIEKKDFWKANVQKFTHNWLKNGLIDRAVTRDISWGVPVPLEGFEHKRLYVWFDAVTGYLSASKEWSKLQGDEALWQSWWKNKEAKHYYFLAKDNIPFHSIIWPSMLMAYDESLNLPYDIPAMEYLCLSGEQFSKSRGIAIWVKDVLSHFDCDAVRYYLTINMPESRDSNWTWDDFVSKNNDELVGTYGNFVHRVLSFTSKNFGEIPACGELNETDLEALAKIRQTSEEVAALLDSCQFKKALRAVMSLAQMGNVYFDSVQPWCSIKEDSCRCTTTLHVCLQIVQALSVMMAPFLPVSSERICRMLGNEGQLCSWDQANLPLSVGHQLEKPKVLFTKLDLKEIIAEEPKEEQKMDPFSIVDLRVAEITEISDHPDADKLYVISINLGELGSRQIVAGMKPYYEKEELLGRHIVVVANLKPAKLRGVMSNGMMLAAQDEDGVVSFVDGGDMAPGCKVFVEGIAREPKEIVEFSDFKEIKLIVSEDQSIIYNESQLMASAGPLRLDSNRAVKAGAEVL